MKLGETSAELYGLSEYPSLASVSSLEKNIVHLEKKYVTENDETSMSPELTQDHSGDV